MKIAFASCSNIIMQKGYQPIWEKIENEKPDLLLLLGDNVYIGNPNYNEAVLECHYLLQTNEQHFTKLLKKVPYLAIWDNHDFGIDSKTYGADVSTQQRKSSRKLFNKYLKKKSLMPDTREVYCSYTIGDIKIIMLDVRSYQECPSKKGATLLGTKQEKWLLKELKHNKKFTVICSGTTFSLFKASWKEYPRWAETFAKEVSKAPRPLFLGGNIHRNKYKAHPKYNFFEVISSSVGRNDKDGNRINNYGIIDYKEEIVEIHLHGAKENNQFHKRINVNYWEQL